MDISSFTIVMKSSDDFLKNLGTILTETARQYFEEKQKNTYLNLSLKDYIIGWMIFEGQQFCGIGAEPYIKRKLFDGFVFR